MDTTNKKTCTFMLDRDIAAAIEQASVSHRISKSIYVNSILATALAGEGLIEAERKVLPNQKAGRKPPLVPADTPPSKPKRKRG
jgi:hypothetical protein